MPRSRGRPSAAAGGGVGAENPARSPAGRASRAWAPVAGVQAFPGGKACRNDRAPERPGFRSSLGAPLLSGNRISGAAGGWGSQESSAAPGPPRPSRRRAGNQKAQEKRARGPVEQGFPSPAGSGVRSVSGETPETGPRAPHPGPPPSRRPPSPASRPGPTPSPPPSRRPPRSLGASSKRRDKRRPLIAGRPG